KRCCGNDSLGVALRKNSSVPGILFRKAFSTLIEKAFLFQEVISPDDRDFQTIVGYAMAILDKLRSLTLNPIIENERT
ncbi:hypothetical protein, partial [Nostoc sp. UCD120]|uniref:hypothetical protein n=2 Tax=unclassified Nostoc TaxID=2593658 RepID=UPI00162322DF